MQAKPTHPRSRPNIDLKRLREEFSSLIIASERLWEFRPLPDGKLQMPLVTATTMTAFGCEIGLKYLIVKSQHAWAGGHELDKLFKKLTTGLRDDIRRAANMNNETIQARLKSASNSFVDWRYFFEHDDEKITAMTANVVFLRHLLGALDRVIQDRYPSGDG